MMSEKQLSKTSITIFPNSIKHGRIHKILKSTYHVCSEVQPHVGHQTVTVELTQKPAVAEAPDRQLGQHVTVDSWKAGSSARRPASAELTTALPSDRYTSLLLLSWGTVWIKEGQMITTFILDLKGIFSTIRQRVYTAKKLKKHNTNIQLNTTQ